MTALLTGQRHNYSRCFEKPPASVARSGVERVEEYIRADPARPFAIAELAALAGVSGRSLYRAFRTLRGYSPLAFARAARLERARERLALGEAGATVTEIALDCGFDHLGRFAGPTRRAMASPRRGPCAEREGRSGRGSGNGWTAALQRRALRR